MKQNIVKEKSFLFSLEVVECSRYLMEEKREFILSKQLVRSGTAVGALIREAEFAESKADFIHKLSISLKESNEAEYWIELLYRSGYMPEQVFAKLRGAIGELNRLLIAILKSARNNR